MPRGVSSSPPPDESPSSPPTSPQLRSSLQGSSVRHSSATDSTQQPTLPCARQIGYGLQQQPGLSNPSRTPSLPAPSSRNRTPIASSGDKNKTRPASVHRMTLRSHDRLQVSVCANSTPSTPKAEPTEAVTTTRSRDELADELRPTPRRIVSRVPRTLFEFSSNKKLLPSSEDVNSNKDEKMTPSGGVAALRARFEGLRLHQTEPETPLETADATNCSAEIDLNNASLRIDGLSCKEKESDDSGKLTTKNTREGATEMMPTDKDDCYSVVDLQIEPGENMAEEASQSSFIVTSSPAQKVDSSLVSAISFETQTTTKSLHGEAMEVDTQTGHTKHIAGNKDPDLNSLPVKRRSRSCQVSKEVSVARRSVSSGIAYFKRLEKREDGPESLIPTRRTFDPNRFMGKTEFTETYGSGGNIKPRQPKSPEMTEEPFDQKPSSPMGIYFGQPTSVLRTVQLESGTAVVYDPKSAKRTPMSSVQPQHQSAGETRVESVTKFTGENGHKIVGNPAIPSETAAKALNCVKTEEIHTEKDTKKVALEALPENESLQMTNSPYSEKLPSTMEDVDSRVSSLIAELKKGVARKTSFPKCSPKSTGKTTVARRKLLDPPKKEKASGQAFLSLSEEENEHEEEVMLPASENQVTKLKQKFQMMAQKSTFVISSPKPVARSTISTLKKKIFAQPFAEEHEPKEEEDSMGEEQPVPTVPKAIRPVLESFSEEEEDEMEEEPVGFSVPKTSARAHCRSSDKEKQLYGYEILEKIRVDNRVKRHAKLTEIYKKLEFSPKSVSAISEKSEVTTAVSPGSWMNSSLLTGSSPQLNSSISLIDFLALSPVFDSPLCVSSSLNMRPLMAKKLPPSGTETRRGKRQELISLLGQQLSEEKRLRILKELETMAFQDFDTDLRVIKSDTFRLLVLANMQLKDNEGFEDPAFDPLETALLTAIINVDRLIDQRLAGELGPGGYDTHCHDCIPEDNMDVILSGFEDFLDDYNDNLQICVDVLSKRLTSLQSMMTPDYMPICEESSDTALDKCSMPPPPSSEEMNSVTGFYSSRCVLPAKLNSESTEQTQNEESPANGVPDGEGDSDDVIEESTD